MGNPAIWYYPDPTGGIEEIDLVDVSMIEPTSERFRTDEEGITGSISVTDYGMRHTYRIARERFEGLTQAGEDLVEKLYTLENHLQRGGYFAFAFDRDKAWGGFLDASYDRGDVAINTRGNVFEYNPSATLATDDRVIIQSANPEGRLERKRISSLTGNVVTLASGLANKFFRHPVILRQRDFLPMLRVPAGSGSIISTDGRRNYTLTIECVEDVEAMFMFASFGGSLTGTSGTSGARSKSVEAAIENIRSRNRTSTSTTLSRPGGS
jgi:hypothetical protein